MDMWSAMKESQGKDGGFNAQSEPSSTGEEGGGGDSSSEWSLGQILGVAVGSAAVAYLAVVVLGVVIGGVVWARRRRRRANPNTETIPLVKKL